MKKIYVLGAIMLITGCATQHLPAVVDMPYCDANITGPAVELTQVERTDSTTELTFTTMYDYCDDDETFFELGNEIHLVSGYYKAPLKKLRPLTNIGSKKNNKVSTDKISMPTGVPVQFKMVFPALPADCETVDLVQKKDGRVMNSIWGIDLTGTRSPSEFPADIPAELLQFDFATGNLPGIVRKDGAVKIHAHVAAWRDWMGRDISFVVNTIDDTQQRIKSHLNDYGVVDIEIPLKGTAEIVAEIHPYNVYADFYADPDEEINLYILPSNHSDAQRLVRPLGVTDGKYRNIPDMMHKLFLFHEYADTLMNNKTDVHDYFASMMKIHSDGLDSIQARNFAPDMQKAARALEDLKLMYRTGNLKKYFANTVVATPVADAGYAFSFRPEQLKQIRESIDFTNPLLELISIGNPGARTRFLQAKELILAE
ncbi:MAG: hypothetical protein K2L05_00215 [Muribaculaceae bacterium]|nr:hypothetical protein [Muribaculaceae bacterium]